MKWRLLLWPFAVLYDGITRVRNHLYNIGHKPSFRFDVPVISVGNLNIGGSGKTPMIEYLIRLLSSKYQISTLSRGYGRSTQGIRFASSGDDASTIGDEPFQFFRKFGPSVKVVVGEERALAIPTLLNEFPDTDLVLLDDAFQHRSIKPSLSILVSEYRHLFVNDFVLPAGDLRESRRGASRADAIVITKCPDAIKGEVNIVAAVKKYAGEKPVFFTAIRYGKPVPIGEGVEPSERIIVLTGIAHSQPLVSHLSGKYEVVRHFRFNDHHKYTPGELMEIRDYAVEHKASVVTTEKDMVRLTTNKLNAHVARGNWFFIPIEIVFLKNGAEFDEFVLRSLKEPIFTT